MVSEEKGPYFSVFEGKKLIRNGAIKLQEKSSKCIRK